MTEIILKKPIQTLKGEVVTSVTVQEPTGKQIKEAQKAGGNFSTKAQETDYQHVLMAATTGLPQTTIEQIPQTDLNKIWAAIEDFFLEV